MLEAKHTKVKIKMLQTEQGADCLDDGRSLGTKPYIKGQEYEVGERLAKDFAERMSVAEYVKAADGAAAQEADASAAEPAASSRRRKGAAPENKSA
jgi:copper oxidase (laccase) domain-containing protein